MGKIKVTGKAKHEFKTDVTHIYITFRGYDNSSAKAVEKAVNECESFLSILQTMNYDISQICIFNDSVEQDRDDDDNKKSVMIARREIKIEHRFDMKFNNDIMKIICDNDFDTVVDFHYKLSDIEKIHTELLKEAVNDSRSRAELAAASTGQSIVGIDEINLDDRYTSVCHKMSGNCGRSDYMRDPMLSDLLEAPTVEEEEFVTVTWLIE